jgi:hypothetical protein
VRYQVVSNPSGQMNVMGCVPRMRTHCRSEISSHSVRTDLWEVMMTIARRAVRPFIVCLLFDPPLVDLLGSVPLTSQPEHAWDSHVNLCERSSAGVPRIGRAERRGVERWVRGSRVQRANIRHRGGRSRGRRSSGPAGGRHTTVPHGRAARALSAGRPAAKGVPSGWGGVSSCAA